MEFMSLLSVHQEYQLTMDHRCLNLVPGRPLFVLFLDVLKSDIYHPLQLQALLSLQYYV